MAVKKSATPIPKEPAFPPALEFLYAKNEAHRRRFMSALLLTEGIAYYGKRIKEDE